MKRILAILIALAWMPAAFAQTAEEIVARMDEAMSAQEKNGIAMTVDIKIPILGTLSMTNYTLGEKTYAEGEMMGRKVRIWSDGQTQWTYDSEDNELVIENDNAGKDKSKEGDAEMFNDITDGYDVSIRKETADSWQLLCRKSRNNTDKDAPKTMDLVVAKGTYHPVSLSARMSGVTLTMRNLSFGVTPQQVTFDQGAFPGAKVVDKR